MRRDDIAREGARVMTVCNSCRYCEQYCAVFPAMTRRLTFTRADIDYLANLCHNCGECLYACQYAPPHEFRIDVPRTLAKARLASYEAYCWPEAIGRAFRRHGIRTALALATGLSALLAAATWMWNPASLRATERAGDFYSVIPHSVMVALFGIVGVYVLAAMSVAVRRFWLDAHRGPGVGVAVLLRGLREALSLRQLHASGRDCAIGEERRAPWRRWFHHCTFYGFLLCFASTSVAAVYHSVLGWAAPYPLFSAPVVLGSIGGAGLLVGPAGLLWDRRRRDPALADPNQRGFDESFIVLLWLTSFTGMLLLVLRSTPWMPPLLIVHLGVVLALFVTLPYGKFMHGLYRAAALVKAAAEQAEAESRR
jgi:citrate/tricarballylate utilization protein